MRKCAEQSQNQASKYMLTWNTFHHSAKPQYESFGEHICMKITSLLFTHYSKPNMLNSSMSMTHEFDVLETTPHGITEPGLPNRDHILAQPFAGKIWPGIHWPSKGPGSRAGGKWNPERTFRCANRPSLPRRLYTPWRIHQIMAQFQL